MNDNLPNCIPINKFSIRYRYFIYFDHKDHVANKLFIQNNLEVKFAEEFIRDSLDYVLVIIRVSKSSVNSFMKIINKLPDTLILLGYSDYTEYRKKFWEPLISEAKINRKE